MQGLKRLYGNSVVYAMGSIAAKAIGFIMIPIYTRCLTPADYGTIELLYRATDVVTLVAAMGLAPAVMRFYFEYKDQRERNEVVSSGLIIMLLAGFLMAVIISLFRNEFSYLIFGHKSNGQLVQLALISMVLELVVMVPLSYVQAEQKPLLFTGISLGKLFVGLSMNIWLIVYLRMGVMGVAWSAAISGFVSTLVILPIVVKQTGIGFSSTKALEMYRYGLPLVPAQLGMFILSFSDRFILDRYTGVAEVGIYSLGYKFGMLISLLVSEPFLRAWLPYALSVAGEDIHKKVYSDTLRHFTIAAVGFTLVVSLMARDVIAIVAAPAFYTAYIVVPVIAFAHMIRSLAFQLEIGILVSKRTTYRIVTIGSAAAVDVGLCFLLIPRYGAMGAAWATAIAFAYMAFISYVVSNKLFPVTYQFKGVIGAVAVGVIIYYASTFIRLHNHVESIAVNTLFLLCYPLGLLLSGVWNFGDIGRLKTAFYRYRKERYLKEAAG